MDDLSTVKQDGLRPDGTEEQMLFMRMQNLNYAIPVSEVVHVLSLKRSSVFDVPFDTSGRVRGIFLYKGKAVAVGMTNRVRSAADLGGAEDLITVILRNEDKIIAVLVDDAKIVPAEQIPAKSVHLNAWMLYSGDVPHDN